MAIDEPRKWMWLQALTVLERVEYLQQGILPSMGDEDRLSVWCPPIDVFEADRVLWIMVALPGAASDSIKIIINSGILSVIGDRQLPTELRRSEVHRIEIPYGRFERRIELPSGNFELSQHQLVNGCLTIQLSRIS